MNAGGVRGYRSPRREAQARETRTRIIAAAKTRFLAHGYAGTTMRAVAADADVSLPTVELAFRTKARLLKAVIDVAIAGDDEHQAMLDRQWAAQAESTADPAEFIATFARQLAVSAGRAAGLVATALEAARADQDITDVAAQLRSQRQIMATWLVEGVLQRRTLRAGIGRGEAIDIVWTLMDPVIFGRLAEDRHWSQDQFQRFFTDAVIRLLLP